MPVRAVLDTNVLVSGLMGTKGAPRQALDAWLEGQFTLVTSLYLVDELVHVFQYPRIAERLQVTEDELAALLAALLSQAEVVPEKLQLLGVTRDPEDDAVVTCAVEGSADYIVSGDQDLLVLNHYEGVRVVTPRQFVEILQGEGC
ncbi:MAG TPA: putative toxin-antitoxin system toxin component, PIN family [Chloroflexi bacterium]|nr:putative toxin-antitoxin system toxin component, PIN family [Chloroflexota bacterium]